MNKPKCAVRGMVSRGAMCGSVIVGGVYCEGTGIDPESFRSPAELACPACSVPDNAGNKPPQVGLD